MLRSFLIASAALLSASAFAADLGVKKPTPVTPVSAACKETKGLPADAFGFASGSDVADLGAWGVGLDNSYVAGYRGGRGYGYSSTLQVSGSFIPCLEVGPYVFVSGGGFKPYGGLNATGTVLGGGIEMKYKLMGRATNGFGLTLAVNPNFGGYDGRNYFNGSSSAFGNSFRLLADAELVKGKLYGALNIELFQSAFANNNGPIMGPQPNTSQFNVRGALSYAATDALFVGAEASYQVQKTGMWGNGNFRAAAAYVGPTFLWAINDKWTLNGTWAYQVAGTDKAGPGRHLGTSVMPLNQARLKLGYAF